MLKIENLTKIYGDKKAVDNLSLHIKPGEIYGFIGHNGAGKTTTIKCCCGILQHEEGKIFIDGTNLSEAPLACKQNLAYIPDNPDLYDFMTGLYKYCIRCLEYRMPFCSDPKNIRMYVGL